MKIFYYEKNLEGIMCKLAKQNETMVTHTAASSFYYRFNCPLFRSGLFCSIRRRIMGIWSIYSDILPIYCYYLIRIQFIKAKFVRVSITSWIRSVGQFVFFSFPSARVLLITYLL